MNIVGADSYKEAVGEGTDEIRSSLDIDLAFQAPGQEIENATLTGAALNANGNALNNVITGNGSENFLFGHGGNDTLLGGDGGDWLEGGANNDQMTGGKGSDVYVLEDAGDKIIEKAGEGYRRRPDHAQHLHDRREPRSG